MCRIFEDVYLCKQKKDRISLQKNVTDTNYLKTNIKKATNQFEKRYKFMKKKYVSPKVDIIYTRLENEMLAGSEGKGDSEGIGGAKAYGGDLDDFTDESMWGDEANENNE